jgi:hypothetical protein
MGRNRWPDQIGITGRMSPEWALQHYSSDDELVARHPVGGKIRM